MKKSLFPCSSKAGDGRLFGESPIHFYFHYFISPYDVFSNDKNIETIGQLFEELKHYIQLRGKCMQLDLVSKMTVLLGALVASVIIFALLSIVILFLSMMVATYIAPHVGSITAAYGLIVLFYLLLAVIVFYKRHNWIEAPIANFLGNLFLNAQEHEQ